jgi:hypothetical protein
MPIPSFAEGMYKEALPRAGRRAETRSERASSPVCSATASVPDERIPAIARRLATLHLDEYLARIDRAPGLDDLAIGD